MSHLRAIAAFALAMVAAQPQQLLAAGPASTEPTLEQLEIQVVRAEDERAIRKLQRAYGHYADRGSWNALADLFTRDAVANYPSGGFDGNASIRAMFVQNLGQGREGLAEGRLYNHIILQPVVDLAADGASATGRWRVLGMLGRFGGTATWSDSLYRIDYTKQNGSWKIGTLVAYAGSGGGYEQGWMPPRPRPLGTPDTSPIRFNLAHPADRPWIDACEQDVSACVVPFPYANRGSLRTPAGATAVITRTPGSSETQRASDLVRRAQRLEDEQSVLNLQRAYGYYIDRGLWKDAAALFSPTGTREVGQAGVYVGRERIRQSLSLTRPRGLRTGELNDHLQLEPVVDIAPDGQRAQARILELAFTGGGGEPARVVQSIAENDYVRRDGVWMIQAMRVHTILVTDYHLGWARSALPAAVASRVLPPDQPASATHETYPRFFNPPPRFANGFNGSAPVLAEAKPVDARQLLNAAAQAQRAADYNAIENLQSAYGYYAEKSLWSEIAPLFSRDGVMQVDGQRHAGPARILAYLQSTGPEGPVRGALTSQLHVQPVIHVAKDGRSARLRSRVLRMYRNEQGMPMWGAGTFENELVKEDGVWRFRRLQLQRSYEVPYVGGWSAAADGALLPARTTLPFHYSNPASGRP